MISAFQFRVRPLEIKTVLGRPVGQKPSIINQNPQTLVRNNLFCVYFVTWLWFKAKIIVIWWNSTFFGGISIDTKTSQNCDHSLSYDRNDTEVISWCDDFSWPLRIRYENAPTNRKRKNDLMLLSVVSFVCACINPGFEIRFRPAVNWNIVLNSVMNSWEYCEETKKYMPKMHVNCSDNDDLTPCSAKERRLTEFFIITSCFESSWIVSELYWFQRLTWSIHCVCHKFSLVFTLFRRLFDIVASWSKVRHIHSL